MVPTIPKIKFNLQLAVYRVEYYLNIKNRKLGLFVKLTHIYL